MKKKKNIKSRQAYKERNVNYINPYAPNTDYLPTRRRMSASPKSETNHERNTRVQEKRMGSQQASSSNIRKRSQNVTRNSMRTVEKKKVSPTQLRRKKIRMQRRKARLRLLKTIMLMLTISLSVWAVISLKEYTSKPKISYQVVQKGTLDTSIELQGLILRNEKVFNSEADGKMQYIVAEGEKVKKGGCIYAVVDEKNLQAAQAKKQEEDDTLYHEADKRKDISSYQDEVHQVNEGFASKMTSYYQNLDQGSTGYIYALRSQLDQMIDNKTSIYTNEQSDIGSNLPQKIEMTQSELSKAKYVHHAAQSGIISYKMDGMEMQLTDETLQSIDYKTYQKMIKESKNKILNQNYVTKGTPIYKQIFDDNWYLISYASPKEAVSFTEGKKYAFHFDGLNEKEIEFELVKKTENSDKVRLLFMTDNQIMDFLDIRSAKFSIGNKNAEGLKIPAAAIVEQNLIKIPQNFVITRNKKEGVLRKQEGLTEFVPIEKQYQKNNEVYIIQDITNSQMPQLNDTLVTQDGKNTTKLTEIETTPGVYVVNLKIAQFKPIDILVQSGDYVLVKPDSTSLKEQDKIISNPKSVKLNQSLEDMSIQNE